MPEVDQPLGSPFDLLTPDLIFSSIEEAYGLALDGSLQPYSSYVNRVYGVRTDDGDEYVAKFYRPGRWSIEAISEEHELVLDCADAELPVVAPLADEEGFTLQVTEVERDGTGVDFPLALYEKRGGRGFDAERDEDWFRLGALAGRVHAIAARRGAEHRLVCTPDASTTRFVTELRELGVVHPELHDEFFTLVERGLELIEPLFHNVGLQRIHGDFHRGNVLERGEDGLLLIDFDDMMVGPPVQDLWLLLPDHAWNAGRELTMIVDGYTQFHEFSYATLELVEPLRFMRMVYYLAWSALQLNDNRFRSQHSDWGGKAFWIREIEDLRTQLEMMS